MSCRLSSSRIGDILVCFQELRMGMGVVIALLLLGAVVVGFQLLSRRKKPGLAVEQKRGSIVELARVAASATSGAWLRRFGEDRVNELLLETGEPDSELLTHLDENLEFDGNLQFLRLSEGYCGIPSWKIKYLCQLANESESFYRWRLVRGDPPQSQPPRVRVQDQWLYTVIQPQPQKLDIQLQQQHPNRMEIRSNVVPRHAYLKRLQGVIATCCEPELCTRGFSRLRVDGEPYHLSCTNCALGEQLEPGAAHVGAELAKLLELAEEEVEHHSEIGGGSEGIINKKYWRKGVFAEKAFFFESTFFREIEIATEVLHPNIVHCFGYSKWSAADQASLYMELLEESLESRIQGPIQDESPFEFQDIVLVLWQVADAMRELHEKRFIHGDLKPGNILLSRVGMPHSKSGMFFLAKVADFGCAQRVPPEGFADPESADGKSNAAVLFNSKIGTTKYAAPEVLGHRHDEEKHRGKLAIPPKHPEKIDVFSFGVVAYQMLTRVSILYEGVTPKELKARVIDGTLRPNTDFDTTTLRSDRKFLFESLVVKCWDSKPECRPSFSDICDFLETFSGKHGDNGHWEFFSPVMTFLKATIAKRKDKYA